MNHHPESSEQLMFDRKRLNNTPLLSENRGRHGMTEINWKMPGSLHMENDTMIVIDPHTFEPVQVTSPVGPKVTNAGNHIDVERYQTYVKITNFREIPRILINTPSFRFDGHGDTSGWQMTLNQRHYNGRPSRTVIRLLHGDRSQQEGVRIRLAGEASKITVTSIEDVITMFSGDYEIVHAHRLAIGPRMEDFKALKSALEARDVRLANQAQTIERLAIEKRELALEVEHLDRELTNTQGAAPNLADFTSEELLAEVHRRTMAAIGDYRGPKHREPVTLDNIINLDDVKRIRFDEERLRAVLAA
jgi:hypothetical protein